LIPKHSLPANTKTVQTANSKPSAKPAPNAPTPQPNRQFKLYIPKIEVDAPITPLGKDKNGNMAAPSAPEQVAWYKLGYPPGENGNAVLAGHLDWYTGAPAVFSKLAKLKVGDDINIDYQAKTMHFKVIEVNTYGLEDFPMQKVFGPADRPILNLITCSGSYDKQSKLYDKRLVVSAKLL
jgi:LPXTG-site transpeptidase (sortase) family protein